MATEAKKCVPCEGKGVSAIDVDTALQRIDVQNEVPKWTLGPAPTRALTRTCRFKGRSGFVDAVTAINAIKDVAEEEGHHPDLHLTGFNTLEIQLYTHSIDALTESDFIVAAKINLAIERLAKQPRDE